VGGGWWVWRGDKGWFDVTLLVVSVYPPQPLKPSPHPPSRHHTHHTHPPTRPGVHAPPRLQFHRGVPGQEWRGRGRRWRRRRPRWGWRTTRSGAARTLSRMRRAWWPTARGGWWWHMRVKCTCSSSLVALCFALLPGLVRMRRWV